MDPRIVKGMAAQRRLREQRLSKGDALAGWKVAFGSPEGLKRLQLSKPVLGFLTAGAALPSGATLDLAAFSKAVVEPEIAILIDADLDADPDPDRIRRAIGGLAPALEIADVAFPPDDLEQVLASDIYQRHWILGKADPGRAGARLDGMHGAISSNGVTVGDTRDMEANTGALIAIVGHVASHLAALGDRLRAGQFIIAGSIVPPIFVESPMTIDYSLAPLGSLAVTFR